MWGEHKLSSAEAMWGGQRLALGRKGATPNLAKDQHLLHMVGHSYLIRPGHKVDERAHQR